MILSPSADQDSAVERLCPGYRLHRYELLYPLARGGMGQVWVGRLQSSFGFEKLFAIKVILPVHAADARFRAMFLDEARIASAIAHPNVAQIFDLGEHEGTLYLVMEYVEGESLNRIFRRCAAEGMTRLPLPVALRIVASVAEGLHAAHELRDARGLPLEVVHRDVSPQNTMLSTRGVVKMVDFGIAKARGRMGGDTTTGSIRGKIRFMAPEQALGERVTRHADIWSLGAMLYHFLTGAYPYDCDTEIETLKAILSGVPPAEAPEEVPACVRQIIARALARDTGARYPTAAAMHSAIEAAMIETGARASSADVAAFAERFMSGTAQARRAALEHAERAIAGQRDARDGTELARPNGADGGATLPDELAAKRSVPVESGVRLGAGAARDASSTLREDVTRAEGPAPAVEATPRAEPSDTALVRTTNRRRVAVWTSAAAAALAVLLVALLRGKAGSPAITPSAAAGTAGQANAAAPREPEPPQTIATANPPVAPLAPHTAASPPAPRTAQGAPPPPPTARKDPPPPVTVPPTAPKEEPHPRTLDMDLK